MQSGRERRPRPRFGEPAAVLHGAAPPGSVDRARPDQPCAVRGARTRRPRVHRRRGGAAGPGPVTHPARFAAGVVACLLWAMPAHAARAVSFRAADGTNLSASLYEPDRRPAPAVVLIHMLARSRGDWADTAERLRD